MAGAAAPSAVQGVAARPRPGRQLPAGSPLLHCGAHPVHQDAQCRDYGGNGQEKREGSPGLIGSIGAGNAVVVAVGRNEESQDHVAAAAMIRQTPDLVAALASGLRRPGAGGRGGLAAGGRNGVSAVSAARSA